MEALYNRFGLEPYDMISIENDESGKHKVSGSFYSLGDRWFIYWNGFEYERLIQATEEFLKNPQPYRDVAFIENDSLITLAKGILFAAGGQDQNLIRVGDELFGISITGELSSLEVPAEVVERFEPDWIHDPRQGLMFSEVKQLEKENE